MLNCFISNANIKDVVININPICQSDFAKWITEQPTRVKNLALTNNFFAEPGTFCLITDQDGNLEQVLLGIKTNDDFLAFGVLPKKLPIGSYRINSTIFSPEQLERATIGWGMGSYQFTNYKKPKKFNAKLLCSGKLNAINSIISSIFMVRDLINMPAGDLYPEKLADVAEDLAKEFNAEFNKITGEELRKNFPAVYAVGRGSKNHPVLIDLHYGDADNPKVVLVGKGVCFDSGGLQLKNSSAMVLMKKDKAGAAHALGLARMIMAAKLPINLRVIIPAVENLISGDSLKPGDIVSTRKGLNIEVTNTDAEGRLILSDALALACEWKPKVILDFATLTGAARVALGTDIVALFTPDEQMAKDIIDSMTKEQEPVWRMPLYQPYFEYFKSEMADFKNASLSSDSPNGGAITAALILQQFVSPEIKWAHFDMNAYNAKSRPAKPEGGEAECLKGLFKYLKTCLY